MSFDNWDFRHHRDDNHKEIYEMLQSLRNYIEYLDTNIEEYKIYITSATIQKFIKIAIKRRDFGPAKEEEIKKYFKLIDESFDYSHIKYKQSVDLNKTSIIVSHQGISGFSYLEHMDNVIDINKPTLLFYGIEQLASYYINLFYYFTEENLALSPIRKQFLRHGIDAYEFKNLDFNITITELLLKKIKLKKEGLAPRFFLLNPSLLNVSLIDNFINEKEISLLDLLENFYSAEFYFVSEKIRDKFNEHFHKQMPNNRLFSLSLTIYLLSFLLSHLSRYKMFSWIKLLESDEQNISFFIKYFLRHSKRQFLRELFRKIYFHEF